MSKSKGEKIQIVAFSANESDYHPNILLKTFLENNNHLIIKQTSLATAFTIELPKTSKQTKIMICSLFKLNKEYTGIVDVNCYLLFLDLNKDDIIAKFEFILNYIKENCDISKKIFVFGMIKDKNAKKNMTLEDLKQYFDSFQILYEYKEILAEDKKAINDSFMDIFNYCTKHPISGDYNVDDKEGGQQGSCDIF